MHIFILIDCLLYDHKHWKYNPKPENVGMVCKIKTKTENTDV